MSQVEEIIRNFCPYCLSTVGIITKCPTCNTEDLIPTPEIYKGIEEFEEDIVKLDAPKSKLELDKNAVDKLMNEDFGMLSGLAGSGKTFLVNELNRLHPSLLEVCSTTGISAINLGTKTLNSTLKYFDTRSLENSWREQLLHFNLRLVRSKKEKLLIDEASMLDAEQLNLICNAIDDINSDGTGKKLGLWLCGDLMQLPPVKAKYIFHSDYWNRFESNTVKLTKIWRQENQEFLRGINLIRANKGVEAMKVFEKCGVTFLDKLNDNFDGTTLISKNDEVDAYNLKRLNAIPGLPIRTSTKIYGKPLSEWSRNIPIELRLKIGALVMIIANDVPEFTYANGDTGIIEDFDKTKEVYKVRLKRNNQLVNISRIERANSSDKEPHNNTFTNNFRPYNDYKTGDWIIGRILYHPLRLAYASTIHRSQGLSLDRVQVDSRQQFFGFDSMGYVSLSRARTPEGLFIVGKPEVVGKKIKMSKEVLKYV